MVDLCSCGSGQEYSACCEPFIRGTERAPTAERLMRSRYTAYARGQVDYLVKTHDPRTRSPRLREAAKKWARDAEFTGLTVMECTGGGVNDTEGTVEFRATYIEDGTEKTLSERSEFRKQDDRWLYVQGGAPTAGTVKRSSAKVGRNDPCPCGSGKKYKKCCG